MLRTIAVCAAVCALAPSAAPVQGQSGAAGAGAQTAADEWRTYGLQSAETRFSPLTDLTPRNIGRLAVVWSADLGSGGGAQEATPLVLNGTIYTITTWSVVVALDARTGLERWRMDPQVNQAAVRPEICCGVVNRGLAAYEGLIIAPVIDGRLHALDAESGALVWSARVALPEDHYTITMAPRIARDKVIVGVSGSDRPTRGFFDAYDARTGQLAWRFYTVPGDPSRPFENDAMRMAAATWDSDWWTRGGGGAVWDGMSYDPALELVYVGTGNAAPWTYTLRSSAGRQNLFVASILAVDVNTGTLRWHYQVVPGDNWDYDSVQQLVLAEVRVAGRPRRVIMQANKNGFFYVLDRVTGALMSATPYVRVNWARGVDLRTGRPMVNDEAYYGTDGVSLSPGPGGAHSWAPMSFNPATGLVYIPASTGSSFTYAAQPFYDPRIGRSHGIVLPPPAPRRPSPPSIGPAPLSSGGGSGALIAWDPAARRIRWRRPGGGTNSGGTVTTAGGLVLQTLGGGRLLAYDARTGDVRLDVDTGLRNGTGPPITYRVDGQQYVALAGGITNPRLVALAVPPTYAAPRATSPSGVAPQPPIRGGGRAQFEDQSPTTNFQ